VGIIVMILVTPKVGAKHELLFKKPASGVFVSGRLFQHSIMFVRNASSLPWSFKYWKASPRYALALLAKTCQALTLYLMGPIRKLRRKRSVANIVPDA